MFWEMNFAALPAFFFWFTIFFIAIMLSGAFYVARINKARKDERIKELEDKLSKAEAKIADADAKLANRKTYHDEDLLELFKEMAFMLRNNSVPLDVRAARGMVAKFDGAFTGMLTGLRATYKDINDLAVQNNWSSIVQFLPVMIARFEQQKGMYAIKSADATVARQKGVTIKEENTRLVTENAALNQSLTGQIGANAVLAETLRQVMLKFEELDGTNPLVAQYYEAKGLAEGRGATFDKIIPLFKAQSSGNRQNENRNNSGNRGGGNNNGNGNNNRGGGNNQSNNDADANNDQNEQTGS